MALVPVSKLNQPLGRTLNTSKKPEYDGRPLGPGTSDSYFKDDMDKVKSQTTGGHLIQKYVTVSSDSIGEVMGVIAVDASGNELIDSDHLVALPCPPYCKGPGLIWPILPDADVLESFEENKSRQNAADI